RPAKGLPVRSTPTRCCARRWKPTSPRRRRRKWPGPPASTARRSMPARSSFATSEAEPMNRARAEQRGRRGEGAAAWWLRLHGWRVLARRVKTPRGEIDLVVRRGRVVAFVEVKWRAGASQLDLAIDFY